MHHFVPGIALILAAGGASVLTADEALEAWLALPFGVGAALTLDESALLLKLDDVYWSQEGIVSRADHPDRAGLLGAALALRVLRRGEARRARRRRSDAQPGGRGDRSAPAGIQMTCSRPGPTPTSAIGTPTKSAMNRGSRAPPAGRSASVRHSPMSSLQPGSSSYSAVAWCSTDWW